MSLIDNKRTEINNDNDETTKKLKVLETVVWQIFYLGLLILAGTLMLYTCRGSQTNLFPTCVEFAPYTSIIPTFSSDSVPTNINITKGDENTSTKMFFSIDENMDIMTNKSFFTWLRNFTEGPKSGHFSLFFASIMQNILAFNFSIVNYIYQFFNNILPETFIIILLPYIAFFLYFGLAIVDGFYFIYLWFSQLFLFCSEKKDTGDPNKTIWEHKDGEIWKFMNWWKIGVAFMLCGVGICISLAFIIVAVIYTFILPLTFKTTVGEKKKYGVFSIFTDSLFTDILKFKRSIIMIFISYILISSTLTAFGVAAATAAFIVCIGLYFFTDIFHKYTPKASDSVTAGLASYDPITKTCGKLPEVQFSANTGGNQGDNQEQQQQQGQGQEQQQGQGQGQQQGQQGQGQEQQQGQELDLNQAKGDNQDQNQIIQSPINSEPLNFDQGQVQIPSANVSDVSSQPTIPLQTQIIPQPINSEQEAQQPMNPLQQQIGGGWKNRSRKNRKI